MDDEDEKAASLVGMGFDEASSRRALRDAGARGVEGALDILLSAGGGESDGASGMGGGALGGADYPGGVGGGGYGTGSTDVAGSVSGGSGGGGSRRVIRCGMSQYDVPGRGGSPVGKSACTPISLYGAYSFLSGVSSSSTDGDDGGAGTGADDIVTPEFLQSNLIGGIDVYSSLVPSGASDVEHLSAEDVLSSNPLLSDGLRLVGGVRQGMLTAVDVREEDNPLGMLAQLNACRSDPRADRNGWMAVIVTKTPETVCVLLPPADPKSDSPGTGDSSRSFVLLDSHPRPHLSVVGGDGSYAILHSTIQGLVDTLSDIFPVTQLSPDVGDLVAMMYNSFDVYALQRMS